LKCYKLYYLVDVGNTGCRGRGVGERRARMSLQAIQGALSYVSFSYLEKKSVQMWEKTNVDDKPANNCRMFAGSKLRNNM
jgi:hypothetical protein